MRTYWKNYFEKTDTLIWVVDATDRERMDDCRAELAGLLLEEVRKAGINFEMVSRYLRLIFIAALVGCQSFGLQEQK